MSFYCPNHNLNIEAHYVMCPLCYQHLLTCLRTLPEHRVAQILAIILGDGTWYPPAQDNVYEDTSSIETQTTNADIPCSPMPSQDSMHTATDNEIDADYLYEDHPTGQCGDHNCARHTVLFHDHQSNEDTQDTCLEAETGSYANNAHALRMLTLERHQHLDQETYDFIHNLVDWSLHDINLLVKKQ